jgi:hypothetical protein
MILFKNEDLIITINNRGVYTIVTAPNIDVIVEEDIDFSEKYDTSDNDDYEDEDSLFDDEDYDEEYFDDPYRRNSYDD